MRLTYVIGVAAEGDRALLRYTSTCTSENRRCSKEVTRTPPRRPLEDNPIYVPVFTKRPTLYRLSEQPEGRVR